MDKLTLKQEKFVQEYLRTNSFKISSKLSNYKFPEYDKHSDEYYVYFLVSNDVIFYVGKGINQRMFNHRNEAKTNKTCNFIKVKKIQESSDFKEVVFTYCKSEKESFQIERYLIKTLKEYGLTNISNGIYTAEENVLEQAKNMLSRVKKYDDWVKYIEQHKDKKQCVVNLFGSPKAFYDNMINNINEIIKRASCA